MLTLPVVSLVFIDATDKNLNEVHVFSRQQTHLDVQTRHASPELEGDSS